jgi:hypothetical protein
VLLMHSAELVVLTAESFESPRNWSTRCRIKTIFELDRATLLLLPHQPKIVLFASEPSLTDGWYAKKPLSANHIVGTLDDTETSIVVTEEQVEGRVLTNKSWLSRLCRQETSRPAPSFERIVQDPKLTSSRSRRRKSRELADASSSKIESRRQSKFFINGRGIDEEVITTDICRYLGNDALVRPGTYKVSSPSHLPLHFSIAKCLYRIPKVDKLSKASTSPPTGLLP